jgi:hypothetical protein
MKRERKQDWSLHSAAQERSQTEFGGVKNLGLYMLFGSILQQLFTLETFRIDISAIQPLITSYCIGLKPFCSAAGQ